MTTMLNPTLDAILDTHEQQQQATETTDRMTSAVQHLSRNSLDAVIPTPGLLAEVVDATEKLDAADRVRLVARDRQGHAFGLRLLPGAHEQLAQRLDMPRKFYDRLLEAHPDLLAHNITELFRREPDNRMLRMLRPTMSEDFARKAALTQTQFAVRAVVSDKYRALDNGGLVDTLLPEANARGLRLVEWNLDDRSFALRFAGPERTIGDIREAHGFKREGDNYHRRDENGRDMAWVDEVLSFGVAITNSETGHGSLAVRQFSRVLRCLNAFVKDETHRTRHVGRKQGTEDEVTIVGADTRRLEAAAQFARVRDRFVEAVSDERMQQMAGKFAAAMGEPLALPPEVPLLTFVDHVGMRFDLSDRERELLQQEVTAELITVQQRTPSAFNIAQGFTAMAKQANDFQRKQEIETFGWQIIDDPTATLVQAAKDAAKEASKLTR